MKKWKPDGDFVDPAIVTAFTPCLEIHQPTDCKCSLCSRGMWGGESLGKLREWKSYLESEGKD